MSAGKYFSWDNCGANSKCLVDIQHYPRQTHAVPRIKVMQITYRWMLRQVGVSRHVKGSTKLLKPCWYLKRVSEIIRTRNQMAVPHRWFGSFTLFLIWHIARLVKSIRIYDTTISHWSCSPSVMNLYDHLKWLYANLAHSQNPQHLATPADTYLQISLMVTNIQDITFSVNVQSFSF